MIESGCIISVRDILTLLNVAVSWVVRRELREETLEWSRLTQRVPEKGNIGAEFLGLPALLKKVHSHHNKLAFIRTLLTFLSSHKLIHGHILL